MSLAVQAANNVKIYNVSSGKTLPQWLSEKKKKALKYDEDFRRRIELVQDLEFPTASQRIHATPDGQFLLAAGNYPPQLRCYEFSQLSMKFQRNLTCDVSQFLVLSEDYAKLALMLEDRTVEFHAQFGSYYKTRIPRVGRDMAYDAVSCDLLMCGSAPQVYRLNLEQGRFLEPLETDAPAIHACHMNPAHRLLALACENGTVECWDARVATRAGCLAIGDTEATAVRFDGDGLTMAVGTSSGRALLFDLRSRHPLLTKDHHYGLPVHSLRFHAASRHVISADAKAIRIWDRSSGRAMASVEPKGDVRDLCVFGDSGLLMASGEAQRVQVYFIPALGPAPRWCSFLENLTEELEEERRGTVYEDYKFVTREELETVGLGHLLGTPLLRAYMHGFFLDHRLYLKALAASKPFAYEEWRKQQVKDRLEKERAARIVLKKRNAAPKVNAKLAEKLASESEGEREGATSGKKRRKEDVARRVTGDARFAALFQNPDFEIDESSFDYARMHPTRPQRGGGSDEEEGGARGAARRGREAEDAASEEEGRPDDASTSSSSGAEASGSEEEEEEEEPRAPAPKPKQAPAAAPRGSGRRRCGREEARAMKQTMGERLAALQASAGDAVARGKAGSDGEGGGARQRRGMDAVGMKGNIGGAQRNNANRWWLKKR
eukprot:tig00000388_g24807.t1